MDLASDQASDTVDGLRPRPSGLARWFDAAAGRWDWTGAARWRCGLIVTTGARLAAVRRRWWPYSGNYLRAGWDGWTRPWPGDRCELYYHQPLGMPGFLTLSYVRSGRLTTLGSFYVATLALDEIARLRGVQAIVCHVTSPRISERLLERWGWQRHCLHWRGRHYIKRFYDGYPRISPHWRRRLRIENEPLAESSTTCHAPRAGHIPTR